MSPEEPARRLLHRDASVLILDKPAGLPVHKGWKGGETLADWLPHLRFGLPRDPELAHRLDRDTSGCLVLGRHPVAIARLNLLFRQGAVTKTYWAVVDGGPAADEGLIDLPMAEMNPGRGWWMKVDPAGKPASSRWRVLKRGGGRTLLELHPLTGRTHQLRVHCAAMGHPIVGDAIYGGAPREGGPGLALHARRVVVPFAPKKPPITAEADPPRAFQALAAALGEVSVGLSADEP